MAKEKTYSKNEAFLKVLGGVGFAIFFLVIIAFQYLPSNIGINWSWIIWGAVIVAIFFAAKKNKTVRNLLIWGIVIWLLLRSGVINNILNAIPWTAVIVVGILWLFLKPKAKKS